MENGGTRQFKPLKMCVRPLGPNTPSTALHGQVSKRKSLAAGSAPQSGEGERRPRGRRGDTHTQEGDSPSQRVRPRTPIFERSSGRRRAKAGGQLAPETLRALQRRHAPSCFRRWYPCLGRPNSTGFGRPWPNLGRFSAQVWPNLADGQCWSSVASTPGQPWPNLGCLRHPPCAGDLLGASTRRPPC